MPKLKLTARTVERLRAPTATGRQTLYWDEAMPGFAVLASGVSAAKTYVVQGVIGGKERRVRIGRADVLSLAEARERAKRILADFLLGHDPKSTGGGMTLGAALDGYLAARKTLRPKTVADYRGVVVKYLAPWLNVRLKDISADMVEKRHRSLHAEVAARGRHAGNAIANGAIRTFGTLFSFAAEREVLPPNPVTRLKRQWFPVERRTRIVRADEMPAFYRAVMDLLNLCSATIC